LTSNVRLYSVGQELAATMKSRLRMSLFQFIFLVAVVFVSCTSPKPVSATSPVQSLPLGSYWGGNGTIHRTLAGTENYTGTWTSDTEYNNKFTLANHSTNSITISYEYSGSWSNRATDTWSKRSGGESNHGTTAPVRFDYTIDTETMKIIAVSDNTYRGLVGGLALQLIDPQSVNQVGTLSRDWYGLAVTWTIGESETINVNDAQMDAWPLSHSGNGYGSWHVGNNYSTGMETITYLYDKNYGIAVGRTSTGNFNYTGKGGSWSETLFDKFHVTDSNVFYRPSTFSILMKPSLLVLIAVIMIAVAVTFLTGVKKECHITEGELSGRLKKALQVKYWARNI